MNPYIILTFAVLAEVFANTMLKKANGFKNWLPSLGFTAGIAFAFYGMAVTLQQLPLGLTYAIWSGGGTVLTAIVGVSLWKEHFAVKHFIGLILIIGGIVLLRLSNGAAA